MRLVLYLFIHQFGLYSRRYVIIHVYHHLHFQKCILYYHCKICQSIFLYVSIVFIPSYIYNFKLAVRYWYVNTHFHVHLFSYYDINILLYIFYQNHRMYTYRFCTYAYVFVHTIIWHVWIQTLLYPFKIPNCYWPDLCRAEFGFVTSG